jgi:cell wall-associated NlpC family hydrolase
LPKSARAKGGKVLIDLKKAYVLSLAAAFVFCTSEQVNGQDRPRVTKTVSSQPLHQPPSENSKPPLVSTQSTSRPVRPVLMNDISLPPAPKPEQLIKKTSSSAPAMGGLAAGRMVYASGTSAMIMRGIQSRLGIPYLYGSTGPNRYDCSGFVWSVFRDAGIDFTRSSARSLWAAGLAVEGDERYKFGTLVFFNGLGHMGIVADENGFYHASSSKGITYSPFKGYWEKRIVGFKRLPLALPPTVE